MKRLESFDNHLKELMKNPEFAEEYDEEKRRLGLAINLAIQRQKMNITQTELAKRAGITQQQLSKLERGENCNMSTFLKVCHSLGFEVLIRQQTQTQI
jgi:HTH-type transcriptional regulator/antitoxin HipB